MILLRCIQRREVKVKDQKFLRVKARVTLLLLMLLLFFVLIIMMISIMIIIIFIIIIIIIIIMITFIIIIFINRFAHPGGPSEPRAIESLCL